MAAMMLIVLIFFGAAAVAWHREGDSVSIGALFVLGAQVVKAISDYSARQNASKKEEVLMKKIDENTIITRQVSHDVSDISAETKPANVAVVVIESEK